MKKFHEESSSVREKSRSISKSNLNWDTVPRKFLIVHKETDLDFICEKVEELGRWILSWGSAVLDQPVQIAVFPSILENKLMNLASTVKFYSNAQVLPQDFDLIITLGGDGTVLLAAWLFQNHAPPIVPFHFGTLGFLTVFNWEHFSPRMTSILKEGSRFNIRMRLKCSVMHRSNLKISQEFSVLNEIVVERGASPFICILELFGDGKYLTTVQADGVAIATPTGSTAYSLSAGGSVVHPDITAILVTPICPHSLSFRPVVVPENLELKIVVSKQNRSNVWLSFDGRSRLELEPEDFLIIQTSPHPIVTLCRENQTSDWFHGLSSCLHWNERTQSFVSENDVAIIDEVNSLAFSKSFKFKSTCIEC